MRKKLEKVGREKNYYALKRRKKISLQDQISCIKKVFYFTPNFRYVISIN